MLGSFEHHVLEKMGKPRAPRSFVHGADVIPEVYRDQRQPMILGKDHFEPVVEFVPRKFEKNNRKLLQTALRPHW